MWKRSWTPTALSSKGRIHFDAECAASGTREEALGIDHGNDQGGFMRKAGGADSLKSRHHTTPMLLPSGIPSVPDVAVLSSSAAGERGRRARSTRHVPRREWPGAQRRRLQQPTPAGWPPARIEIERLAMHFRRRAVAVNDPNNSDRDRGQASRANHQSKTALPAGCDARSSTTD